ncbi:MAG: hypothetical protein R3E84_09570 [Pseudomonadales bacterium]
MRPEIGDVLTRMLPVAALTLLVLSAFAFWPAYLSDVRSASGSIHAHAAFGAGWLVLLILQPVLIRGRLHRWHRCIGRVGLGVGVAFLVSSVLVAHRSVAVMSAEQFAGEGRFVYLPLAMAVLFGSALALAVHWRHVPALHGRFMAATSLALLDPLFGRLLFHYGPPLPAPEWHQVPAFLTVLGVFLAMAGSLPAGVRGQRMMWCYFVFAALLLAGFFVVPSTAIWLTFVDWFVHVYAV